ncbi:MAG: alkyl hydroperoxide reductase subunit C [Firmicutes bacterium]|nr:alkyl hydroperoxide reductase subunit C [Bacillota bacterium]MCL1953889.1 alkyl hydroperoxide reductase subunit C [Bacillota bacterium]
MVIGKKLENFSTQAFQASKGFVDISFEKDFLGKWSVVCFYPADFTFVCPTELEDLQSQYATLKGMGVEVYSCSTDTHFVHKAWHDHSTAIGKVEYIMLGDPSHKISKIFEVLNEDNGLAYRGTFVINPEGVVQTVEINELSIGRDAKALVDKVRAAQYIAKNPTEVCPAKWKEDGKTLKPSLDLVGKI